MRRAGSAPRSSFTDGGLLLAAVLLSLPGTVLARGEDSTLVRESIRLSGENATLRRELDLATGDAFYYLLDPGSKTLRFMYEGNLLHEYRLLAVDAGTRRGLLGSGSPPEDWADRIWEAGRLDPPRRDPEIELDTSDENYEEQRQAALIPPTPEEAYPAPAVWRIRYRDGLSLEIHGVADTAQAGFASGRWLSEGVANLFSRDPDVVRIRVSLPRAEADDLYRGVPPATRFAVVRAR